METIKYTTKITTDDYGFDLKAAFDALFVLYGTSNQGKTSTLYELLKLLGSRSKTVNTRTVTTFIKSMGKKDPKTGKLYYADTRVVIPYENHYIAIATFGDNREVCEDNMFFFRQESKCEPFYFYTGTQFVSSGEPNLTKEQTKELRKVKPTIFLSACRTEGGAVDAMEYCSHYYLKHIARIFWVRKFGNNHDYTKSRISSSDKKYAKDLADAIDRIVKGRIL